MYWVASSTGENGPSPGVLVLALALLALALLASLLAMCALR